MFLLQAVTAEPNVHGGQEGQAGGPQEEGLHVGPGDIEARVGLSRSDLRPRAPGPENMTTAQNGHGRGAAVPGSISDPKDPGMGTHPACRNGVLFLITWTSSILERGEASMFSIHL